MDDHTTTEGRSSRSPLLRVSSPYSAALCEQLTESQRLATVGTIAAVIGTTKSNNLLTPIASYSQMALNAIDAGKEDAELTKSARQKHRPRMRAGKICTSMLSLVRGERENRTVRIQVLIDESWAVLAAIRRGRHRPRVQVQPDSKSGDPVQLEQVLLNLLINARQAMLGATTARRSITIKADRDDEARCASTSSTPARASPSRTWRGSSSRSSRPRPPRTGEHRGSGLGLHICKQIIEVHGGRIDVESTPGRGTTFGLLLPAA